MVRLPAECGGEEFSKSERGRRVMFSVEGWDERGVGWSFVIGEETKYYEKKQMHRKKLLLMGGILMVALALSSQNSFTDFTLNETKIKWRRKGALIGGIWGLICGGLYGWNALVTGFSPYDVLTPMFDSFFEKIIFFPAFVTDSITNYLFDINEVLIILAVPILALVLWFFIVWSTKISRKICIGGSLLLLILTISPYPLAFLLNPLSLGLLSIAVWFAVVPVLLSVVFGILLFSTSYFLLIRSI